MRQRLRGALEFIRHEAASGVVLLAASALALLIVNSPAASWHRDLLETSFGVPLDGMPLKTTLHHLINDGLMTLFFLLVGLEIKREFLAGELSSLDQAALPVIAAAGGMIAPALIYAAFNASDPIALRGWAIPAATDIAFAMGVVALLGRRVPLSLKVFLLALAIIDDLGAILLIALFYTSDVALLPLVGAAVGIAGLVALNLGGATRLMYYIFVGVLVWGCVLHSGIHPTLAGVVVALAIPLYREGHRETGSPLASLERGLHPWVAFGVLPLFGFANAGVPLGGIGPAGLLSSIPLGIAAGLVVGKPLGIVGFAWAAIRAGLAPLPKGASWRQMWGVAALGGIGFTMSLFIGILAFPSTEHAAEVRLGVLGGSLVSALIGYTLLRTASPVASPSNPSSSRSP